MLQIQPHAWKAVRRGLCTQLGTVSTVICNKVGAICNPRQVVGWGDRGEKSEPPFGHGQAGQHLATCMRGERAGRCRGGSHFADSKTNLPHTGHLSNIGLNIVFLFTESLALALQKEASSNQSRSGQMPFVSSAEAQRVHVAAKLDRVCDVNKMSSLSFLEAAMTVFRNFGLTHCPREACSHNNGSAL